VNLFQSAMTVDLTGNVDEARLADLRLRLRPQGRLGDDWDQILGQRIADVSGGRVEMLLYRLDGPGPWEFLIHVDGEPRAEALRSVQDEVVAAVLASGLTVSGIRHHGGSNPGVRARCPRLQAASE
jgi:hypothetical protein